MGQLDKSKYLIFSLIIGVTLIIYSWCLSYPLSINSLNDYVFNNISILYWFGLPLTLATMLVMAITFKSRHSKWIIIVSFVITIYSLSYFYYMLPSSDSHYFRGLTEYFIKTKDLDPTIKGHFYYQWPAFFLLSDIATSIMGIPLTGFEFLLYTLIGFLFVTALYVYASKALKNGGFLAVVAFFMAMYYFLNYQCVPFSLAFALFLLMVMLETKQKSTATTLTTLFLFAGTLFLHAFVPLFFILYLFIRFILDRGRFYGHLFTLTLIIYFLIQVTMAQLSFEQNIRSAISLTPEYSKIVETIIPATYIPIDVLAQTFSRIVTILTVAICFIGFVILLIRRKLTNLDKAIFLTGFIYSAAGTILFILGSRAIPLTFIPVSLGASYFLQGKFRKPLMFLFLILIILFTFIPLHSSFYDSQIIFQTEEAYKMESFMIDRYNWTRSDVILAHVRVITYLRAKHPSNVDFENDVSDPLFPRIKEYDSIVYTVGLGKNLLKHNYTSERILREEKLNMIYNNGLSYIAVKARS